MNRVLLIALLFILSSCASIEIIDSRNMPLTKPQPCVIEYTQAIKEIVYHTNIKANIGLGRFKGVDGRKQIIATDKDSWDTIKKRLYVNHRVVFQYVDGPDMDLVENDGIDHSLRVAAANKLNQELIVLRQNSAYVDSVMNQAKFVLDVTFHDSPILYVAYENELPVEAYGLYDIKTKKLHIVADVSTLRLEDEISTDSALRLHTNLNSMSIFRHELGHQLDYDMYFMLYRMRVNKMTFQQTIMKLKYDWADPSERWKDHEVFAESFAVVTSSMYINSKVKLPKALDGWWKGALNMKSNQ